jgi:zinc transporter 2
MNEKGSKEEFLIENPNPESNTREETIAKLKKLAMFCATFMLIELVGGYWSNSIAVISDSLHMVIDLLGYLIQIYSARLATYKPTRTYTFSFYRSEAIGGLINCCLIWACTIYLLYHALMRFVYPPEEFHPRIMLVTAILGVLMNLAMSIILVGFNNIRKMLTIFSSNNTNNEENGPASAEEEDFNLKTTIAHIQGDVVYSVGVLISSIVINIYPNAIYFDSICTLLFSYIVLEITIPIIDDSIRFVLEGAPNGKLIRS